MNALNDRILMSNGEAGMRWMLLSLLMVSLGSVGCSSEPTDSTLSARLKTGAGADAGKVLADMGQPDLAVIVSGQLDGYLEPCGCSKGQAGGLVRRYELIEKLRGQGWPMALIDLGGLMDDRAGERSGIAQAAIKFRYILKSLRLLKYDALALSADDLKLGFAQTMAMYRDELGITTSVLAANVRAGARFEAVIRPSLVVAAGAMTLGVTAVIEPAMIAKSDDPAKGTVLPVVEPPGESLSRILKELESSSDYQALLVQGSYELAERLARAHPGFDLVVATSDAVGARNRRPEIMNDGKTRLVTVGRRGYNLGVLAFYRGRAPAYHLVSLSDVYDGAGKAMKTVIQQEYREALREAGVVEKYPRVAEDVASGSAYVGAKVCSSCHANTFKKWSVTKHARAFDALVEDTKPNTVFDAECVTCHTTGFKRVSGWRSEATTAYLAGNQCENCHGPGSRHVAEPNNKAFYGLANLRPERARGLLCVQCHDQDNSPDFDLTRYWSRIVHNRLDARNNPAAEPHAPSGKIGK